MKNSDMFYSIINGIRMLRISILWVMNSNSVIIIIIGYFWNLFRGDYHITYWSPTKLFPTGTLMIFNSFFPPWNLWLNNIPTVFIKMMGFAYPHNGISIQFPLITQIFHIFNMHDFRACQNFHSSHLWDRGSWHWHICIHVTPIVVCHLFHIMIELSCCFYFQTAPCCFLNGTNSTAKAQTNSNANRYDSVNISCCKVPFIYFSIIDCISQWRSVMLSLFFQQEWSS